MAQFRKKIITFSLIFILIFSCTTLSADKGKKTENKKPEPKKIKRTKKPGEKPLKTRDDKVSYCLGLNLGSSLKQQIIKVNLDALLLGIRHSMFGNLPLMTGNEIRDIMVQYKKEMIEKQNKMIQELGRKNKEEGKKFLAKNKKKPGVITLKSGLQYKVIMEGKGKKPKTTDEVKIHFRGSLINGTELDNSYKNNKPVIFKVGSVLAGWAEALLMMNVGSEWILYVPPDLALGEQGNPPAIPPHSVLIFSIKLISIK